MAEYISREDEYIRLDTTIIAIDNLINEAATGTMARTLFKAKDTIYNQQRYVIDVQPVRHGRWYHNTSKYISELDAYFIQACCSCCSKYSDRVDSYSQLMSNAYCSHCGARMDGDTE